MEKTISRFITLTGDDLSFETRQGSRSLSGRVCLKNGSFCIDTCSFDLLTFKKEIDVVLSVCSKILESITDGHESITDGQDN